MDKKMKNLFQAEQMLELNLHNCSHQLKLYNDKLKAIDTEGHYDTEQKKELKHFKKLFKYYRKDLIPALDEILEMDARHLKIIKKNPDQKFTPVKIVFTNHGKMLKDFFRRFEEVHQEFHDLTVRIHRNSKVVD